MADDANFTTPAAATGSNLATTAGKSGRDASRRLLSAP